MCFSAKASFITSALLAATGALTISHIQKREQIAFALITIFFAFQQFSEGMIWLITGGSIDSEILLKIFTFSYLTFAFVIWPSWVPFSVYMLEKKPVVKKIMMIFVFFGMLFSSTAILTLLKHDVSIIAHCNHIYYYLKTDIFKDYSWSLIRNFYIVITILPFFWSSRKSLNIFGLLIAVSALLSYWYWQDYFVSVWCFFAALLSVCVYLIIRWQNFKSSFEEVLLEYKD